MGVFKLGERLWEFEITYAHDSSLTVAIWIYKGSLSGLRVISIWGISSYAGVRRKPEF